MSERVAGHVQNGRAHTADVDVIALFEIRGLSGYPASITGTSVNRNTRETPEQGPVPAHMIPVVVGVEDRRQATTRPLQVFEYRFGVARIDSGCFLRSGVKQQENIIVGESAQRYYLHILPLTDPGFLHCA